MKQFGKIEHSGIWGLIERCLPTHIGEIVLPTEKVYYCGSVKELLESKDTNGIYFLKNLEIVQKRRETTGRKCDPVTYNFVLSDNTGEVKMTAPEISEGVILKYLTYNNKTWKRIDTAQEGDRVDITCKKSSLFNGYVIDDMINNSLEEKIANAAKNDLSRTE